jgi:hypothetical protein
MSGTFPVTVASSANEIRTMQAAVPSTIGIMPVTQTVLMPTLLPDSSEQQVYLEMESVK